MSRDSGLREGTTVICNAFSGADYVHEAILGIQSQGGGEIQILLYFRSEEGEVFRELIEKYNNLAPSGIFLQGVPGTDLSTPRLAMLDLIPLVTFDTVAICNGDDYWLNPNKIKTQKSLLDELGISFVCHPVLNRYSTEGQKELEPCIKCGIILLKDVGNVTVHSSSMLFKTESLLLYEKLLNSLRTHTTYSLVNFLLTIGNGRVWNDLASVKNGCLDTKDAFARFDLLAVESKQLVENSVNRDMNYRRQLEVKKFFLKWSEENNLKGLKLAKLGIGAISARKIVPAHGYKISRPSWLNLNYEDPLSGASCSLTHPGVSVFDYQNVTLTADTDFIVKDDLCLVPRESLNALDRVKPYQGSLWRTGEYFALLKKGNVRRIKKAIKIGGLRDVNYYHLIIESLPKLFLIEKYSENIENHTLLLPIGVANNRNYMSLIRSISPNREVLFLDSETTIECEDLIVSEEVSWIPFNLKHGRFPKIEDHIYHEIALKDYFNHLRAHFIRGPAAPKRRLYLRRLNNRRPYNEESLFSIAAAYGFEAVETEFLTVEEQARLFAEASHIVGPSGAGWTNVLFSSGSRCLSWLPREYGEFCCFTSIASFFGSKVEFIESIYERPVRSTSEVFRAPYEINEGSFEKAIRYMLETPSFV